VSEDIRRDPTADPDARRDPTADPDVRRDPTGDPDPSLRRVEEHDVDRDGVDDDRIPRDPSSERVEPERVEPAPSTGPGESTTWSTSGGLLPDNELSDYQRRWDELQVRFIDEPRQSVREADDLVSEVTRRIADRFSSGRKDFEQRWEGGDEPTTEELRQAVQRYRDFFQRLVTQ
jgi:hypothetical protein